MTDLLGEQEPPEEEAPKRTKKAGSEDDEQAEWLADALARRVRFDHTAKRWHQWDGIRWAPDRTMDVPRQVMDLARERLFETAMNPNFSKTRREFLEMRYRKLLDVNATTRALIALSTRPEYKTDGADWDQDPVLLGCQNGILDLTRNQLVPNPGPELLVTRSTGHAFTEPVTDPSQFEERAPRFVQFLREITSDDNQLASFFLLWFGYSLFGHTVEQKFLILTGIGRNGKGALVSAMRHVFGEYSAAADQNLYMRSKLGAARSDSARADLMELKGKRLAAMSEPDGGVFNEELLKAHTGGDPITARALYSNNVITWAPTHTITFLTNELPKVSDIGPSMAARVMVADFRERFDGDRVDKRLGDKLAAEAEGILAILAYAAHRWHASETGLALPDRVIQASAEYLNSNDPVGRALNEAFVVEKGAEATGRALYDAYLDWHSRSEEDGTPLTNTAFGIALARRGLTKRVTSRATVYLNIRPKTAFEVADDEE